MILMCFFCCATNNFKSNLTSFGDGEREVQCEKMKYGAEMKAKFVKESN